jgi:hypothetical protein
MPLPMSASAALKMLSPRKNFGNLRLLSVRDDSPGPDFRSRSNSIKRKEPDGISFASVVTGNAGRAAKTVCAFQVDDLSDITLEVAKVSSLVETASTEVNDKITDPVVVSVFSAICDAMRGITTVQDKVVTCLLKNASSADDPAPQSIVPPQRDNLVNLGAIAKKPRQDFLSASQPAPAQSTGTRKNPLPPASKKVSADPVKANFIETIREAERSTLVFNLNMGRVPIMNKDTLNKKAAIALTALAATKEKKSGSIPSNDAIDAIDDVLSLAENYQILGNTTKSYRNPKDPDNSGSYCTAPVRYDFKNKDTRVNAEKVLRDRCGVSCAVPYPVMVRESIKQIVAEVKKDFPDNYVKVAVDTEKMVFKIARKPPKNAPDPKWQYDFADMEIPPVVLDTGTRKVPDGFKLGSLSKKGNNNVVGMSVDTQENDGAGSGAEEELT